MTEQNITRRETLRRTLTAAGLLALVPEWATPALAEGEMDVPFTDVPATFKPGDATTPARMLDLRQVDGLLTPRDKFFALNHYNRPELDAASHRVKFTGLVKGPAEFSLADLKAMHSVDVVTGYECSGNSPRSMQGLCSNGKYTGVRLSDLLKKVGVQPSAREVVFFGADRGKVWTREQTSDATTASPADRTELARSRARSRDSWNGSAH